VIVGVTSWELHLPASQSLKDKRRIVKSLKDRLHQKFGVSAAEVDHQDLWQRALIAAAVVSGDARHAEEVLASCDRLVRAEPLANIIASETTWQ
jgi:uncharacterized protein YlxP (DUF503 family)